MGAALAHGRYGFDLLRLTWGEIYRVWLPASRGREQAAPGFAIIVQAEELLGLSTAIVAPTSRSAAPATFRPEIVIDGEPTRVMLEQLRAVDVERLDSPAGRLTSSEQLEVDQVLTLVLGLN